MSIYLIFLFPSLGFIHILLSSRFSDQITKVALHWSCLVLVSNFFLLQNQWSAGLHPIVTLFKKFKGDWLLFEWGSLLLYVDHVSFFFIFLSNLLVVICIIISWESIKFLKKEFYLCLMATNILLIGVFVCMDLLLFYICFEAILVPIFLVISIWGARKERYKASYYFFFYTLFGSLFMLLSIFKIYGQVGSTSSLLLSFISVEYQIWFSLAFFLSLAIKVPMFPVHIWLPQAHVEAPVSGSVLLAGILLKLGGYGFYRFFLPLLSEGLFFITPMVLMLSIVGIIYASILTIKQTDIKRLIAYSSVSHMGFVTLGLFSNTIEGFSASIILMVAHGFVSSGLFISATVVYDRFHSRIIRFYKGLISSMPILGSIFLVLTLANISIPGSLNFWGELLAFNASLSSKNGLWLTIFILLSIVFGAIYSVNLFNSIFFGASNRVNIGGRDVLKGEFFSLSILSFLAWIIGLFAFNFINTININILEIIALSS